MHRAIHVVQIDETEKRKQVKGPRCNNYGVASNVPPDKPVKCVHMLDVEDLEVCAHVVPLACRCSCRICVPVCVPP
jgi:hypothetical protein